MKRPQNDSKRLQNHRKSSQKPLSMARIWDFSVSFEPKTLASALARFWQLDGWKFTTLLDANQRPVDHCPISLEPMEDPVLVCDGHIYDKNSITQWLAEGNKRLGEVECDRWQG